MKKISYILVGFSILMSNINAGEYLVNKQEYFSSLQDSCNIKVWKGLTLDIDVVCGKGGGGCSGHSGSDGFACNTFNGNSKYVNNGVNGAITWILNNYQ